MSAGFLGTVAMWAAIAFAAIALATGRRWALIMSAVSGACACLVLGAALVAGDFSLAYAAETTSLSTPWPYRLAALWGGMDGSMLFYTTLVMATGAAALRRPIPIRTVAVMGLGLMLITLLFANPFVVLEIPAVDGAGLLAILQHPAMIYHPPILYLGLTILIVPFALTVEMALGRGDRSEWMSRARIWLYASWTLLTVGMAAGANWAYVELGWGGFWAWDAVENTALMPWIAITVFLHSSRVEEATGRLRRWNVMVAGLPFALTVMGVYLTRSGATGSIHSFAEDPVVGRILLIATALVASLLLVLATRTAGGEAWGRVRLDRDGWLSINAALLTGILVFVVAGSAYPAFASAFRGETVTVDSRFFVVTVLPLAVVVAVSLAMAIRGEWAVRYAAATAAAAALTILIGGLRFGLTLMAPALAALVLLTYWLISSRVRGRRLIAHLAHIGMALLLVGIAGSSFGEDFEGSMGPGDIVDVAGHRIELRALETGETDRYVYVRADFAVDGEPMRPEIRAYEDQGVPVAEPVLRSLPIDDVIVAISLLFPDARTVAVSVFVRPLVVLVWAGAALIAVAGLTALFGRAGAVSERHRSATEEPRPGETTTEGVAR